MEKYKNSEAFIDILNAHGVEKIFINPGFEAIDVLTQIANNRIADSPAPQMILCLDESVAASGAYGNYMVSGKPQVVMVHSELGTLQLGANLLNLQWGRVPALILAAHQGIDANRLNWKGDPYDQGSIVRNSVKYEIKVEGDEDICQVLNKAFCIACTEPKGPVYISFPMEYLYKETNKPETPPFYETVEPLPTPDEAILKEIASLLLDAEHPLLISGNAGRYPENVAALVTLAETISAKVLTGYSWMNFPTNHPLCLGIEQIGGSRKQDEGYEDADVILAIDYDMPYVGSAPAPRNDAILINIDVDPTTQGRLLWGRGANIFLKSDSRLAIPALTLAIHEQITPQKQVVLNQRFQEIAKHTEITRNNWYNSAREKNHSLLTADYVMYCLNQLIDEDTIIVNHTLSHCASVTEQIVRTKPGTWFGCPSGSIGWAPGAALGASTASNGKKVVAIMTDGGFIWGCPTSALWSSNNYHYPFLAIICNNHGYGAIRDVQYEVIGNNQTKSFIDEAATDFSLDYTLTAKGAGALGLTVTKPTEVIPSLKKALECIEHGQSAVLDVHLSRLEK